eukprot:6807427-Prymnesium_polylepis.1
MWLKRARRPSACGCQGLGWNVHALRVWWKGVKCGEHLDLQRCSHSCSPHNPGISQHHISRDIPG